MSVASRRERERRERRNCILEAAAEVFRRRGIAAATMEDIATEAELSKGTLYLYFASKDELFLAMAAQKLEAVVARFDALEEASEGSTGLDLLTSMLEAYAEVPLEDPDMFRVALMWMSSADRVETETPGFEAHRQRVSRLIEKIIAAIERGRADGSIRTDGDARQLAAQLWGGMVGSLFVRISADELRHKAAQPIEVEGYIQGFVELLRNGLRPREDA